MIDLIHTVNKDNAHDTLVVLLKLNSLFQLAIDQMIYHLYRIPQALQLEIEHDLKLDNLRQEWPNFSLHIPSEAEGTANILEWYQSILSRAKSFIDFSNK